MRAKNVIQTTMVLALLNAKIHFNLTPKSSQSPPVHAMETALGAMAILVQDKLGRVFFRF